MAQYNPQAQQGGGGRGGGGGGRGYQGRGGGPQQQGRPMGAWQPSAPTSSSLQQAAYGRQPQQGGYHPQQHHQQHHHSQHHHNQHHQQHHQHAHPQAGPPPHGGPPGAPHGGPPAYHHNPGPHHYNPYAQQAPYGRGGQAGPGGWQPAGYPPHQGGVYYPPANAGHPGNSQGTSAPVVQPPKREKKPLVITDKNGNVLDFRSESAQKKSSLKAAVAAGSSSASTDDKSKDPGSKLREAALARINQKDGAKETASSNNEETPSTKEADKTAAPAKAAEETPKKEEKATDAAAAFAPAPAPESAKRTTPSPPPPPTSKTEPEKPATEAPAPAAAKEEKKDDTTTTTKSTGKSLAEVAAAPAPPPAKAAAPDPAAASKSSSGSSLASASKKSNMAAVAAAPAPAPPPKQSSGGLRPGGKTRAAPAPVSKGRIVYDKTALLKFKTTESCMKRPDSLPDMTIVKGPAKQQGGGGGGRQNRGGDGGWNQNRRRNSQNRNLGNDGGGGGGNWERGQAPPRDNRKGGGGRGGNRRNSQMNGQPEYTGPVAPLKKTANGWKPTKNNSPLDTARKQVKGILNKMTKEKFDTLSAQMCDIQILSYEMLTMMIHNVYEKAIDEPSFGDMYADLCVKLSKGAAQANNDFVKLIESDEEPPTEGGGAAAGGQSSGSSSHIVYRWSNDVNADDNDVVGPFPDADASIAAAINDTHEPTPRGDMKLEIVKLVIKKGIFIKLMKKKDASDGNNFYVVYFKVAEAKECGQQLSEIFLSEVECVSNAKKKNSFKRSLLNKCEDEFKKQDIYEGWKKEKSEYEESKSKLKPAEQAEREEELDFRRIKIKKQMLGNIKFIGQLYKKNLLKEKIMRFCIASLLKLDELQDVKSKNPEYKDSGKTDMDEEDHEAICSMFSTIGSTIDKAPAVAFMKVCFTKIHKLSLDKKNLPARSRFMYKDLLELRENNWVPRRDEGKAKTLDEIKKDFEREEKKQAQQSAQAYRNDQRGGGGRGQQGGYDNRRGSNYGGGRGGGGGNRGRQSTKPQQETDDDGFTVIARGTKGHFGGSGGGGGGGGGNQRNNNQSKQSMPKSSSKSNFAALQDKKAAPPANAAAALSPEKLERRIKTMRAEFMQDPKNLKELLLSMDELSGTKDAGFTLVVKSADALLDCKEQERKAITDVTRILFEQGKLSKEDIRNGLADFIEFIDSMIMDCPKLFEYMGDWLAVLFVKGAIDVAWYCDTVEKTKMDPDAKAPEMLTRAVIASIKGEENVGAAKDIFGKQSGAMNKLCGADKWSSISNELLG